MGSPSLISFQTLESSGPVPGPARANSANKHLELTNQVAHPPPNMKHNTKSHGTSQPLSRVSRNGVRDASFLFSFGNRPCHKFALADRRNDMIDFVHSHKCRHRWRCCSGTRYSSPGHCARNATGPGSGFAESTSKTIGAKNKRHVLKHALRSEDKESTRNFERSVQTRKSRSRPLPR